MIPILGQQEHGDANPHEGAPDSCSTLGFAMGPFPLHASSTLQLLEKKLHRAESCG